jgi:hypothetical protein
MAVCKPDITNADLLRQFWLDIFGKEVQSAATYSYLWIADQVGHLAVGILVHFAFVSLLMLLFGAPADTAQVLGFVLTCAAVAFWEIQAYRDSANKAGDLFPLNKADLAANARIATAYMCIGAAIGLALGAPPAVALPAVLALLVLCVMLAPTWLRQKMIWQKAALPYLSRLAMITCGVSQPDAELIEDMITSGAPPERAPRQLVIAGPSGCGLTTLACGIGTELAFRNTKVRYLTFDKLVQLVSHPEQSVPGPRNINYWPWREAQVLIVDDVVTGLNLIREGFGELKNRPGVELFREVVLKTLRTGRFCPLDADSIWVLDDLDDPEAFAHVLQESCGAAEPPHLIRLAAANA